MLGLAALLGAGCGKTSYKLAPVSGQVTLRGQPMAGVHVSFQPTSVQGQPNPGPGSFGLTDEQGRFVLRTIDKDRPGAVVGHHVVRLTTAPQQANPMDDAGTAVETLLPPSAGDGSLRFEVPPGGTDQANFSF